MKIILSMEEERFQPLIRRAAEAALHFENVPFDCEVEALLAEPEEMRRINREQRGVDRCTDVLSFPMEDNLAAAEPDPATGAVFLGSMIICPQQAERQAEEYGHSLEREIAFLTVHSVLHLLGYDHEQGEEEEREMFAKQEQILAEMGLSR